MEDLTAVGVVPDPVLLLCGRPASAPSRWWTPSLAGLDAAAVAATRRDAAADLDELGVRDPATGRLRGLLGTVAEVVAAARVVLLVDGGPADRRSVVAAPEVALLDRQVEGGHELLLAAPAAAVGLLTELLAGVTSRAAGPTPEVLALAGRRQPHDVAAVLPPGAASRTRITRTVVGDGVHLVTVVAGAPGAVACWALPDGGVHVQVLDRSGVIDLAVLLLGADPGPGRA